MKICPRCRKTYADDNLNFCLEDGSVLTTAPMGAQAETIFSEPRVTQQSPQPQSFAQPGSQPGWNAPQSHALQQPRKSSKTWIWVLLILGGLILLCGGGFIGFLAYVGSQVDKAANLINEGNRTTAANANKETKPTVPASGRTRVEKIKLVDWVKNKSPGFTEFSNGEFIMASKEKGYYYVVAGTKSQKTENADTRVTLRNVNNAESDYGYGLVFHSDPKPLQQGYAFLIDSNTRKYRIVHHKPQNEVTVEAWTASDAIRTGAAENTLEVRDLTGKIELYINGEMVTSIKNEYGYKDGVVGLYTSDAIKIAFKSLEISR